MFEPEILVFCCNWCSYAGADLAGISRIKYPPNVKIIRTMCSGRVEPSYILKALEYGADGVLVTGCHPGECHYTSGNLKAEERVKMTGEILETLGLRGRLRLEWISASEGKRFANIMSEFTEEVRNIGKNPIKKNEMVKKERIDIKKIIDQTKVYNCVECGKCTASCPIAMLNHDYSPRKTIEKALEGLNDEILVDRELWSCLTCGICEDKCPSGVNYLQFVRSVRSGTNKIGGNQSQAGAISSIMRILATEEIRQNRIDWTSNLDISRSGEILYFVGCLPYFDIIFKNIRVNSLEIAESTIKILNKAGISPVVLEDERCCGHDLLWSGDFENFERLAKINVDILRKTEVKKIIFSCPECYRTFKIDYQPYLGGMDIQMVHISEFIEELIEEGRISFDELDRRVTYHDPCRLGRHLGVYEPPRNVINTIPGVELIEMRNSGENSTCCGVSAWVNCDRFSKQMQMMRMDEARETGSDLLITSCPKCQIHLRCALFNQDTDVEIEDITNLCARVIKSK
jgi:Fe-S oxidoreductase/coenzyme F420-reducing hydrogenase delta subunit